MIMTMVTAAAAVTADAAASTKGGFISKKPGTASCRPGFFTSDVFDGSQAETSLFSHQHLILRRIKALGFGEQEVNIGRGHQRNEQGADEGVEPQHRQQA